MNITVKSLLLASAVCVANACSKQTDQAATKENETVETQRIAYVELDTLMSQYQLYKDYSEVLTRKGNNIQNTLAQKQRNLEAHAADLQKKYDSNAFTTRDELESAQAKIQREQQDFQELAARLNNDFNAEQAKINEEARDSIQNFLKSYNKTKKFDFVMVKAGDNLLIANPRYDITSDVVKGLNKRYKASKELTELLKENTDK